MIINCSDVAGDSKEQKLFIVNSVCSSFVGLFLFFLLFFEFKGPVLSEVHVEGAFISVLHNFFPTLIVAYCSMWRYLRRRSRRLDLVVAPDRMGLRCQVFAKIAPKQSQRLLLAKSV